MVTRALQSGTGYAIPVRMQAPEGAWLRVQRRMEQLGLREEDLEESFVLGSGKGGQKVNKTAHAVQLCHRPSGRVVTCAEARSQHLNRLKAREKLCGRVEEERVEQKRERDARRARIRFQKRKPGPGQTLRRVKAKRQRGEVKRLRRRPGRDD